MTRLAYIPNRIIDHNGIADGATVHVYLSGSTTPVLLYSDSAMTVPLSNPFSVAAGAAFPDVFYDSSVNIKLTIVSVLDGSIEEYDPYNPLSISVTSPLITVKAYGAVGDSVTDDHVAIQAAINAAVAAGGGTVFFEAKTYLCPSALTWSGAPVCLLGSGSSVQPSIGTILKFPTGLSGAVNPQNGVSGLGVGSSVRNLRLLGQAKTATVTVTIASPGVVTWTAHGLTANTPVIFSTTGALPTGITAGVVYFVSAPTTNTFSVSATSGGATINTSGSQSGMHTGGVTVTDANGLIGIGSGLLVQSNGVHIEDIVVQGFEGHGILNYSDGTVTKNANCTNYTNVRSWNNLKAGIATNGSDSNAGISGGLIDLTNNWQTGLYENASVGNNVYNGLQLAGNGSDAASAPIVIGPSGGFCVVNDAYKEIHGQSTLLFRTTTGGSGQNKITVRQAAGSSGSPTTFTVDDQTGDTEWRVQGVTRQAKFGGDGANGTTVISDGLILQRLGAKVQMQDNPLTANWFLYNLTGNPVLENGGVQYYQFSGTTFLLDSGIKIKIGANQVVGPRDTGWTADTGTAKKTANATYTAGSTLTYSAAYVQSEQTAMATRVAALEVVIQSNSQTIKGLKDTLIAHGLIGA